MKCPSCGFSLYSSANITRNTVIYSLNNTTYIVNQYYYLELGDVFRFTEPSLGQFSKHSTGTGLRTRWMYWYCYAHSPNVLVLVCALAECTGTGVRTRRMYWYWCAHSLNVMVLVCVLAEYTGTGVRTRWMHQYYVLRIGLRMVQWTETCRQIFNNNINYQYMLCYWLNKLLYCCKTQRHCSHQRKNILSGWSNREVWFGRSIWPVWERDVHTGIFFRDIGGKETT